MRQMWGTGHITLGTCLRFPPFNSYILGSCLHPGSPTLEPGYRTLSQPPATVQVANFCVCENFTDTNFRISKEQISKEHYEFYSYTDDAYWRTLDMCFLSPWLVILTCYLKIKVKLYLKEPPSFLQQLHCLQQSHHAIPLDCNILLLFWPDFLLCCSPIFSKTFVPKANLRACFRFHVSTCTDNNIMILFYYNVRPN